MKQRHWSILESIGFVIFVCLLEWMGMSKKEILTIVTIVFILLGILHSLFWISSQIEQAIDLLRAIDSKLSEQNPYHS